jgi:hypothetical protein
VGTTYKTISSGVLTWYIPGVFGPVIPVKITERLSGVSVGGGYNLRIKDYFRIDFGLNYLFSWNKYGEILISNSKFHSINVPIELTVQININDDLGLSLFIKPALSCGIASKSDEVKINGVYQKIDYYKQTNMNRFNVYLGPGVGIRFKNIILKGGVDWSLYKVVKEYDIRQNQFYIKLAYCFPLYSDF